jgi:hypothetical protein
MAYGSRQNLDYDGNKKDRWTNYIKDLVINDLTIPLRLIQYTNRYKQAHQLFDNNKDKIINIVSHSLWSVIAHPLIHENEQLNGRVYSTPSLARPRESIKHVSHYGDPIAMFILDKQNRKL